MSFKCLLYLACFSGQILTGGQRVHIGDILCRIGQGICRSRITDAEAAHRLNQLVGITDIKRAAVMEFDSLNFGIVITEVVIYLNSFVILTIDRNLQIVTDLFK